MMASHGGGGRSQAERGKLAHLPIIAGAPGAMQAATAQRTELDAAATHTGPDTMACIVRPHASPATLLMILCVHACDHHRAATARTGGGGCRD